MGLADSLQCIRAYPGITPPAGLFANLSSRPNLISCLVTSITLAELLELMVAHLLNPADDPMARSDDPQGSLTKFGEGIVLVEAAVHHFGVSGG